MKKIILTFLLVLSPIAAQAGNSQDCLAKAIYFESRGGSERDQLAVGHTVMNRVDSSRFPNSVCSVVRQRSQFSPHINKGTSIREPTAWRRAKNYAQKILSGNSKDFTKGATYFHTPAVKPRWSYKFPVVYRNNQHIFYKH